MRILFLGPMEPGGVSNYIGSIINNVRNPRFFVPLYPNNENLFNSFSSFENVKFINFNFSYSYNFIKPLFDLKKCISENNIQLIHVNVLRFSLIVLLYKLIFNSKIAVVYTPHGLRFVQLKKSLKKFLFFLIEYFQFFFFDKIIFIRRYELNFLINIIWSIHRAKFEIIYSCFDFSTPQFFSKGFLISLLPRKFDFVVGMVGSLYDLKNPYLFLEVAKSVLQKNNSLGFVWIGDGPLKDYFLNFIEINNLNNNVFFLGQMNYSDVKKCWFDIDVLLLSSKLEVLPTVVLECFYFKKLVISNDYPGSDDLIVDGVSGFIFSENNLLKARDLILSFSSSKDPFNQICLNGHEFFLNNYSDLNYFSSQYLNLYERCLKK